MDYPFAFDLDNFLVNLVQTEAKEGGFKVPVATSVLEVILAGVYLKFCVSSFPSRPLLHPSFPIYLIKKNPNSDALLKSPAKEQRQIRTNAPI